MITIPLLAIANQTLSIQLDGDLYDIAIYATKDDANGNTGIMAVNIVRNNEIIISGVRAVFGYPLLPYAYEFATSGNFAFSTQDDQYPDWRQFGITQYLIYASNEEIQTIRDELLNGRIRA